MNTEKLQVVFLVDTKTPTMGSLEQRYRSQCLACTRVLLHLSKFPNREHPNILQWHYKLFSSRTPAKSLRLDTAQFHQVSSEILRKFFSELELSLSSKEVPDSSPLRERKDNWGRCVYSALVTAVQDLVWDAPEIRTPVHPRSRHNRSRLKGRTRPSPLSPPTDRRNIIFLFSEGPIGRSEPGDGGGGGDSRTGSMDSVPLGTQVLPRAMQTQLHHKNISVYWVQSGVRRDIPSLSNALKATGGGVIPISIFLDPMCEISSALASSGRSQVRDQYLYLLSVTDVYCLCLCRTDRSWERKAVLLLLACSIRRSPF